jgi:4-amino-4-deoxy-L-arabinose transferase-like glycosyltransferase
MTAAMKYALIIIAGVILFVPFLGDVHLFDWDEINFAECAREMIVSKDYLRIQIDFQPFWEKPPLFIWMQVLAMKIFGINAYAARFPNAVMGIATLVTLFYAGKRIVNERMGMWWSLLYAATWLPHFYFKSGIIDPTFNFFIFSAFFQLYLLRYAEKRMLHALLCGIFLGAAVMTKGPVAILIALLSFAVYIILNKGIKGYKIGHLLLITLTTLVTTGLWFGVEIMSHGWWFVNEFITYQIRLFRTEDADHGGPFIYHFIILLIGCFPASLFLFQYNTKPSTDSDDTKAFTKWMWIMFWVVLILFSIVKTKIVHYSSLCYFPLTYLAALQLYRLEKGHVQVKKIVVGLLLFIGTVWAILIIALPIAGINKQQLVPLFDDPFAVGNLQANVSWNYAECLYGIVYLIGIWVAVLMMRKHFRKGIMTLCILQLLMIQVTVLHITPKIEGYSQKAAIDFFESMQGKDVYVKVLGYKSYAQLFYTQKLPPANKNYYNEDWLLTGPVDKPTYFVCKVIAADKYKAMPQLEVIQEKNGFVFFKRK